MTPTKEEQLVRGLLKAAEVPSGPEHKGQATITAFRSLARSRGVDLETVLRAAVRDELPAIAALPPVHPSRHGSGPATVRAVDGGDGTTCRVIR